MPRTGNCASCSVQAASKAALISLAKTMSAELLPRCAYQRDEPRPGDDTPLYGKLGFDAATLETVAAQIQNQIPLGPSFKRKRPQRRCCISPWPIRLHGRRRIVADSGMSQL